MNVIRIASVVRRHWLVLWRGPHRWFEIVFWPVMDVILWGSLGLYVAKAAGGGSAAAATAANLLLAGIVLFWSLTVVQMTMSISVMDETNTRNLLNVLTTSVTPGEYLVGVAVFGLIKLFMTMAVLTLVTLGVYGFSLASIGAALTPIALVLVISGWAVGFIVLGLIIRFGPSAEILTWGINYVMMSLSGVFFPASSLPGGIGKAARFIPAGKAFDAMRAVLGGEPAPWHDIGAGLAGALVLLALSLLFCGWMLRVFRRRGFVTRYS